MSKFTDAAATALKAYFETGDQPTAAQFAAFIDATQEGIEEHDHNAQGDGDAANVGAAGITNRTRKVLIPALSYKTGGTYYPVKSAGALLGGLVATDAYGFWRVPEDFVSGLTIRAVGFVDATGNMRVLGQVDYGSDGEQYNTHSNTYPETTVAAYDGALDEIAEIAVASAAKGDSMRLGFTRKGAHGDDTADDHHLYGWVAQYTADS